MKEAANLAQRPLTGNALAAQGMSNHRSSALIAIVMGNFTMPENWIEALLDRIEARP